MSTHDLDRHRQARNQAQIEDAAIEWIARLRASDVTDAERADFAEWLAAGEAHKRAFDDMAALWGLTAQLDVSYVAAPTANQSVTRRWAPLALAAGLLMAFALLLAGGGDTYRTEPGEQRRVVRSDGSNMYLNTATRVEVRFSRNAREVLLDTGGEAYFEVAREARRPFVVHTAHGTVEALGTAFNVLAEPEHTAVAVAEGRVGVTSTDGDTDTLEARQQARLAHGEVAFNGANGRPADIASWRTGRLVYDGVTLQALVQDLNRYLPKPMSLADTHLADMPVSAVLTLQEQDAMLDALARSLDLRWTTVSDNLILLHAH